MIRPLSLLILLHLFVCIELAVDFSLLTVDYYQPIIKMEKNNQNYEKLFFYIKIADIKVFKIYLL